MRLTLYTVLLAFTLTGCQTMYNRTMENVFGYEKRELLKRSVRSVKAGQEKTQSQFQDTLEQVKALYGYDGGNLERMYRQLKAAYERSSAQAESLKERIRHMDDIADAMFAEWKEEADRFSNEAFRKDSRRKYEKTRDRYQKLANSAREAAAAMDPVLRQLDDHVLYLKHNLNADALAAFKGEAAAIETDIETVIRRMNDAIGRADAFIEALLE